MTQPTEPKCVTEDARSVLIDSDVFEQLKAIQKGQTASPRFDLRGLTSAALRLILDEPEAARKITFQAGLDFKSNLSKSL
jgi:branched-subunit amino acid aminotransferase/4-amino-4-deoxychorismate lyase